MNGARIRSDRYSYTPSTGALAYTPATNLPAGTHSKVQITATDPQGLVSTPKVWYFNVK